MFMNLLTRNEQFSTGTLVNEGRRVSVDGSELFGVDGATFVNRLTDNINDSAESFGANGDANRVARVVDQLTAHKTLGGVQSDGSHVVATQVLGDLEHESVFDTLNLKRVVDGRQRPLELHVHDGTNNLRNLSFGNHGAEATYTSHKVRLVAVSNHLRAETSFESMLKWYLI